MPLVAQDLSCTEQMNLMPLVAQDLSCTEQDESYATGSAGFILHRTG